VTAWPCWRPTGSRRWRSTWPALQAGWYVTPINWHFTAPEIAYIVRDSGEGILVTSGSGQLMGVTYQPAWSAAR